MAYTILRRKWRVRAPMFWLMVFELAGLVPLLVLFGIEQPDLFRTRFWQIGFDMKMNSNPNMILYAYANFKPLPTVPFVWSSTLTEFNVAISVISLFVLLTKMVGFIMRLWYPIISLLMSLALVVLYTVSVYGQAGPDYADSRYPSPSPWYIRLSCDVAKPYGATKDCMMAKGTFAVTIYMLALYLVNFGLSAWSMAPNKRMDAADDDDEEGDVAVNSPAIDKERQWEMRPVAPVSPSPFTPRTQAFNALDRRLPLRQS